MTTFPSWTSYWEFEHAVTRQLRYVRSLEVEQFLKTVLATSYEREAEIKQNTLLWRAQIGCDWRPEGEAGAEDLVPCAYKKERMEPRPDCALDGRANPRGIPCLYLADQKETAIAEVRPWVGSYVSVAQFKVMRSLRIIDCSKNHGRQPIFLEEPSPEKRVQSVWTHIDRAFAKPITRDDDSAAYVPTQIIAELFKSEGFDGIGYKSSCSKMSGFNIALFDLDAAALVMCGLHEVNGVQFSYSDVDIPYFI